MKLNTHCPTFIQCTIKKYLWYQFIVIYILNKLEHLNMSAFLVPSRLMYCSWITGIWTDADCKTKREKCFYKGFVNRTFFLFLSFSNLLFFKYRNERPLGQPVTLRQSATTIAEAACWLNITALQLIATKVGIFAKIFKNCLKQNQDISVLYLRLPWCQLVSWIDWFSLTLLH